MNASALHLVLGSFPLVLNVAGICMLIAALSMKSAATMRAALIMLLVAAVIAIPVFITGNRAVGMVRTVESVNRPAVEPHREASLAALIFGLMEGALVTVALFTGKRGVAVVVLLFAVVATSSLFYAMRLGERIHHPELEMRHFPGDRL